MKILIVDDSVVFRSAISSALSTAPDIEVVKSVPNGKLAVDAIRNFPEIDLITLDMEMPVMDGMTAIKEIRQFNKKVIIIVFSSLTQKGAEKTIEALNHGANDFVTKPEAQIGTGFDSIAQELMPKILEFKRKFHSAAHETKAHVTAEPVRRAIQIKTSKKPDLFLIGCSTGGPEALTRIFQNLKDPIPQSILLVQHMPPMFTTKLAEMLNRISALDVVEASDGMVLKPNTCYIAPGDYHMTLENKVIRLNQAEKVCFVRPSVDVLFQSVAKHNGLHSVAIVLTGMGEDGAQGSIKLKQNGCDIFIQDKESSVVWGMPGAVAKVIPEAQVVEVNDFSNLIYKLSK
jgi:two-component system chemotaxis response regulator CheB